MKKNQISAKCPISSVLTSTSLLNHQEFLITPTAPPYGYLQYLQGHLQQIRYTQLFDTSKIAYPEPRRLLIKELSKSERLGSTRDGKSIYLISYAASSSVIREIGRLREMTFRAVGEGTQTCRDLDEYDKHYRHIVMWDNNDLEIVGAYRIGEAYRLAKQGKTSNEMLYTASLFNYGPGMQLLLPDAIELGRSFIQERYWSSRALDCLWQGVGVYLQNKPHIRYLFGAVSISNEYPTLAKQQIVACYAHCFRPSEYSHYALAKNPFKTERSVRESYRDLSTSEALSGLKQALASQGLKVPVLFKHYAELCEHHGVSFIDFNIDHGFANAIDGLILLDLHTMRQEKRNRYLK